MNMLGILFNSLVRASGRWHSRSKAESSQQPARVVLLLRTLPSEGYFPAWPGIRITTDNPALEILIQGMGRGVLRIGILNLDPLEIFLVQAIWGIIK